MKVALVYDRVNKWGGAERVLLALHRLFPEAPLYTSVYNEQNAYWAKKFTVYPSFLQKIPFSQTHHELIPFLMPIAFEQFSFDIYDLVISVTSEAAKGIITKPTTKHICYCLTPTRYLWSGYEDYFRNEMLRTVAKPMVGYLRKWDQIAATRPDRFVAISEEVRKRIKKYYSRDADVVYPSVSLIQNQELSIKNQGEYFLIVSRLSKFTQYKRIDLAIQACNALRLPLKIIGEGNWQEELRAMSGSTIEFVGNVSDRKLSSYYKNCKALLFPGVEDFGLTVIEAQSFGKPVIAYRKGGALETIQEGKTGLFFDRQTKASLIQALQAFEQKTFAPQSCVRQAERFRYEVFAKAFLKLVQQTI